MAHHGEKIVIAHKPEGKRTLGLLAGQIHIPDHFTDEDPDVDEMFYGH